MKKPNKLLQLLKRLRPLLFSLLKERAIKFALKKIFGTVALGGPLGWLVTYILEEIWEEYPEQALKFIFRKLGYVSHVVEGKIIYEKIEDAENRDDWRDIVRES